MSPILALADLVADLVRREEQVRRRDPEGVHRARVTCRRLRAVLPAYRGVLGREVTEPLRAELRWLGGELGEARDRHVVGEQLTRMLAEEPPELTDDAAVRRIARTYGAGEPAPGVLDSARYAALRSALEALPDLAADERALRRRARKELSRVEDRYAVIAGRADHDVAMHELRKAAKRLRYVGEAWQAADGKPARRLVEASKRLTTHLGARQDTVVTRAHLVRCSAEAASAGESTFVYGRMHAREQRRAEDLDTALPTVWRRFRRTVASLGL